MDLYLVRHAIAETRDSERWPDDSKRPLTKEGAARFRRAARGLHRIVPTVELVLASPWTRAWQTAEILREDADWPAPEPCPALEGDKAPAEALGPLQQHGERESVALVGHEPYLSYLASLLLAGDERTVPIELKKGGVILLELAHGSASLRWSASPKLLRGLDIDP